MKFRSGNCIVSYFSLSVIGTLFLNLTLVQGQTCYSCTGDWGNTGCIDTPSGEVICPENYWCRTERQEYKEEPDKVHRFTRGCFEEFLNYTDINAHWITYFTSCKGDKCNSGDGIRNDEDTGGGGAVSYIKSSMLLFIAPIILAVKYIYLTHFYY